MKQKVLIAVVVVFLGFWLFTDPRGLAATAETAGGSIWTGAERLFQAVITFVNSVL